MNSLVQILLIVVVLALVVGRRLVGRPVEVRRSVVVPAVLALYGLEPVTHAGKLSHADILWLSVQAALSIGLGLARGTTVRIYPQNGVAWARYTPLTLLLWVVSIAGRFGLAAAAVTAGADAAVMRASVLLMFGLSLAAESLIVLPRAHASGVPVLTRA